MVFADRVHLSFTEIHVTAIDGIIPECVVFGVVNTQSQPVVA